MNGCLPFIDIIEKNLKRLEDEKFKENRLILKRLI
jgi:hypothetical protein